MMTFGGPRYDSARFGMEVFRASPRQADLMIVAGRVSQKMAPVLRQIYDQMPEPKWVLAMGVCASSGGMFNNYAIVQGVDHVVPGRHVPARLPAASGDADRRHAQAAPQDHERAARPEAREEARGPEGRARPVVVQVRRDERMRARASCRAAGPRATRLPSRARPTSPGPRCATAGDDDQAGTDAPTRPTASSGTACSACPAAVTRPASAAWSASRGRRRRPSAPTAATSTRSSTRCSRRTPAADGDPQGRRRPRRADAARRAASTSPTSPPRCATTRACASSCVQRVRRRLPRLGQPAARGRAPDAR